ncbi:hypothetical protein [Aquabacterium sp. J223]|uniref:hypothetical protein n=1 Tax=Aquabacterium sp. J223 TaxID=2898431 RepID=UPI0021ADD387|nr:hypothetical protein [Aquabacterium sp. J223]UUX95590.1 hypothetical protein LRS07_20705 [Aquabacterium sp. J223]
MQQPVQPYDVHGLKDAPQTPPAGSASGDEIEDIYQALKRGLGHERVNDGNVQQLIARAREDGHQVVQALLTEWQASC